MLFRAAIALALTAFPLAAIVLAVPAAATGGTVGGHVKAAANRVIGSGAVAPAVAAITRALDLFNKGDVAAFFAAHTGDALIIDEFAPYRWTGIHAAESWAADYDRDAKARGISEGRVDYGKPTRAEIDGLHAYVVLPTVYTFRQKGVKMREEGQMTFVMAHLGDGWKISSWTWSGPPPGRTVH